MKTHCVISGIVLGLAVSASAVTDPTTGLEYITRTGDPIFLYGEPNIGSAPADEGVANAINGNTLKYLNFGTDGDTEAPFVPSVGFEVTPLFGGSVVTSVRFFAANDGPNRDPAQFQLFGSNDGTNFALITDSPVSLSNTAPNVGSAGNAGRNAESLPITDADPNAYNNALVSFSNGDSYTSYRLLVTQVRNNAAVNSTQMGEVQLLGQVPEPSTIALLGLSTLGVGFIRRRSR